MPDNAHTKITQMSWDDLEKNLIATGRRGSPVPDQELREYFGEAEYAELQKLAARLQATRQTRAEPRGNIVFLPGIMGSELSTVESGGDPVAVWVSFFRLIAGRLQNLQLDPDGKRESNPGFKVVPTALDKRTYTRAVLWLKAHWKVVPFPYDWRKDLDEASDELAKLIKSNFAGQPVHLVAHSMGGLVSRNFIRLHGDLWKKMQDPNGSRGGRLVMLGTPNYGSFTIPQVLTGAEKLLRLLASADLKHDLGEILAIVDSFVGSYQMLPSPAKIPPATQQIYRREAWGEFPVSVAHLRRAEEFHAGLEGIVDPDRMLYVAGYNRETLCGLRVVSPGQFEYSVTYSGDGRVPHDLGLLPGVPTYYVEETHGDLAKNDAVLTAVEELLDQGKTTVLATEKPVLRALVAEGTRWRRSIGDLQAESQVADIARRADRNQADSAELHAAEAALVGAIVGRDHAARPVAVLAETKRRTQPAPPVRLKLEIVRGDVTRIQTPLVVVGHYRGVKPINALGALDHALDHWITRAGEAGMIGGGLGELFFIPAPPNCIGARTILLAGMGEAGKFTREDLRYLMMNITLAASGLGLDSFASVLIGAGNGGLSRERALRALLLGVRDGLRRLPARQPLQQISLVECLEKPYDEIRTCLTSLEKNDTLDDLKLTITARALPVEKKSIGKRGPQQVAAPPPEIVSEAHGPRITVERGGDIFRFSAMTTDAVVPVREVPVQALFADGVAERLRKSDGRQEQERYGRLLHAYLMPEDFQSFLSDPLTLILDRSTAAYPWEMACSGRTGQKIFYGPDLRLTRQFRTLLSGTPGVAPVVNRNLRVLVIADPAPEREYQLPGARAEGRAVVKVLNQFKGRNGLQLEVVDRIGASECDPVEILALILSEEFDVIHYAGHGTFDTQMPERSGWVFGKDVILSAREIFRARQVPRLVFANACFSAVVRPGQLGTAEETNRQLAGLAEAFFERGVQNYLGSGWPVGDVEAVAFATEFYTAALAGESLSTAIAAGRAKILHQGSTWGAYQHYGEAGARLVAAP